MKKKLRELSNKDGVLDSHTSVQSEVVSEADIKIPTDLKSQERKDSKVGVG